MGDTDQELEGYREFLMLSAQAHLDPALRGKIDASDIVQQTLLDAHVKRSQFRGSSTAEKAGWLRQILANNLRDALRSFGRARRDVARERSLDAAAEQSSQRIQRWLHLEQTSPSQRVQRQEEAVQLAAAMAQLPEAQREALLLQIWHGWTITKISEHMARSPSAVAGLLKRGMKHLRELMENRD